MELRRCLDNLKHDVSNGGLVDDTFPVVCYVTMANKALRILHSPAAQQDKAAAEEYLTLCRDSGTASLRSIATV